MIPKKEKGKLTVDGINILYDGQVVGQLTINEGTSLYEVVVLRLIETNNDAYNRGFEDGSNI